MTTAQTTSAAGRPDWSSSLEAFNPMLRELERYFRGLSQNPILPRQSAAELRAYLPAELPEIGLPIEEVFQALAPVVTAGARANADPRMFGYICGSGLPTDPAAHAWAAGLNQIVTSQGSAPGAVTLERQFVGWMSELFGLPAGAGGLLVSGGSIANLSALAVATTRGRDPAIFAESGWHAGDAEGGFMRPMVYASKAAHFSVRRALRLLGLGQKSLRTVACDREGRLSLSELRRCVAEDQQAPDNAPAVIVANAGSTGTGAIDPLAELAEFARAQSLHLHVDAAYGGAMAFSDQLKAPLAGIESADSLCFDLHKWGFTAFDASLLLYRDAAWARQLFSVSADYASISDATSDAEFSFFHHGIETSRRARALPMVVALLRYGRQSFGDWVEGCVAAAERLRQRVQAEPKLELVAGDASIVCFRYLGSGSDPNSKTGSDEARIDDLQESIRNQLNASGKFLLSGHRVEGRAVLRVCIVNWATRAEHVDALVDAVLQHGDASTS